MQNESINDHATAIKHGMYVGFRFLFLPILTLASNWLSNVTGLLLDVGAGKACDREMFAQCCALLSSYLLHLDRNM